MGSRKYLRFLHGFFFRGAATAASFAAMSLPAYCRRQTGHRDRQCDGPGGDGRRGHRRPIALRFRNDGLERNRVGRGRTVGDLADQRGRRRLGPQDQDRPRRRCQRLADLRREGRQAARTGQVCRGLRLLDFRLAEGRVAGVRKRQRHALLPDLLRRSGSVEERDLHGSGSDAANHLGAQLGQQRERLQDVLPDRLGLHLAPHLQQDRPVPHRAVHGRLPGRR